MAQKSMYFMKTCAITQGANEGSHIGSKATDHAGANASSEKCYMPWDGKVVRCRSNANGECYIQSLEPVEYPDGTIDYQKAVFIHDGTFNVQVGSILKQGEYFYDEGGMGSGNPNTFGNHVHVEFGRGKWKSAKQFPNEYGTYVIEDQINIEDAVFMPANIIFRKDSNGNNMDGGLDWKYVDIDPTVEAGDGKHAIDLSDHNGKLDYSRIYNANKAKAIGLRTGYGSVKETQTDECLHYNVEQCLKYKYPMFFYNFSYAANVKDAIDEANMVIDILAPYKEHIFLPVYFDFEEISARYINKNFGINVTRELIQDMTIAFCERIKEAGYKAGVYCNLNYYKNFYGDEFFEKTGYSFWYARPGIPEPDKKCDIWQCAVTNGVYFGIDDVVDQNVIYLPLERPVEVNTYETVEDKVLFIKGSNCEYFTDKDVNTAVDKLELGASYPITAIDAIEYIIPGTDISGTWVKILVEDKGYHCLVLEDRCEIIDKPVEVIPEEVPDVVVPETTVEPEVQPEPEIKNEPVIETPEVKPEVEEVPEENPEVESEIEGLPDDEFDCEFDGVEPPVAEDSVPDENINMSNEHSIYDCIREVIKWLFGFLKRNK